MTTRITTFFRMSCRFNTKITATTTFICRRCCLFTTKNNNSKLQQLHWALNNNSYNSKNFSLQNELSTFRENEASERAAWERECRQRLDEDWKSKESGFNHIQIIINKGLNPLEIINNPIHRSGVTRLYCSQAKFESYLSPFKISYSFCKAEIFFCLFDALCE